MKSNKDITIIDMNLGNIGSVVNMVKKVGGEPILSNKKNEIAKARKLILPGDGAFDAGIKSLKKFDLIEILNEGVVKKRIPILGVCLGMQLFAKKSEEGKEEGLGWITAETIKFSFSKNKLRIPHMGWNTIKIRRDSIIYTNMPKDARFYFIHSYHLKCNNPKDITTTTEYGYDFASGIEHDNIYGVQFHPEKSHKFGMILYKNFLEIPC